MKKLICSLILLMLLVSVASAAPAYPDNLWQGLIGEATSEGYEGLYAVACVVRNRLEKGMDTGLVALKRPDLVTFCAKEGHSREVMAKRVVREVFELGGPDTVKGALYFENVGAFGTPKWAKGKKAVARIGKHTFYK